MESNFVLIIDFGSQTTELIARRIRELCVKSKVLPWHISASELKKDRPSAIILSGGPQSLKNHNAPRLDKEIYTLGIPILGICYGMQLIASDHGGVVRPGVVREFGKKAISHSQSSALFFGISKATEVWMSHFDQVFLEKSAFRTIASSDTCTQVAIEDEKQKLYGVQFHPEVSHTVCGLDVLSNFIFRIAGLKKNHVLKDMVAEKIRTIKSQVGSSHVIMGLSGGVDSSVAAALIAKALGENLTCVYVNHGLHRQGEIEEVKELFENALNANLRVINAEEQFFYALKGITDPEEKRKIIGRVFVEVFESEAKNIPNVEFLGQGTLYPDVIESACKHGGPSHVIKTHHNVGGLPEGMSLKLLEPLRDLFKDEVRAMGKMLGLPDQVTMRQPFPGPGLAIRIPGEVSRPKVERLRLADAIVCEEIAHAKTLGSISELWQWFAILLPITSVGVQGDARVVGDTVVVRVVDSIDAMTADWSSLPRDVLVRISSRIGNEVPNVSRVLYDITQKPPGTIEWE